MEKAHGTTMIPKVAILQTDGTNCDGELFFAFKQAGGKPEMVHINDLISGKKQLSDFHILGLPGGFSYGDDVLSGKVLANELRHRLKRQIDTFITQGKLVIGVCNGFQTLVRMGYLPWAMNPAEDVSLIFNNSGHFECRWVRLEVVNSRCVFTNNLQGEVFEMPVAHGEGKLVVKNSTILKRLQKDKHVVFQYIDTQGNPTMSYPQNPNGSIDAIAGITDTTGRILGLMPHPERHILPHQHPQWQVTTETNPCNTIFEHAVAYISNHF